jgi:hypothetical protein
MLFKIECLTVQQYGLQVCRFTLICLGKNRNAKECGQQ